MKLYKNKDDRFGSITRTMTIEDWRRSLGPNLYVWFNEARIDEDSGLGDDDFRWWVDVQLSQGLEPFDGPIYMNPETGSVDSLDGWHPYTPEKDGLVEVVWNEKEQNWEEV